MVANQLGYLAYGIPLYMILYTIGRNASPIVAIVCVIKDKAMPTKKLFKKTFAAKQPLGIYLFTRGLAALHYAILALLGKATIVSPLYIALFSLPIMVFGGGLEEVGNIRKKFLLVITTTGIVVIWAVWHLPLFYIQGTYQSNRNFGLFVISVFSLSFALTAICRLSNSLWFCLLFHSIMNATLESVHGTSCIIPTAITAIVLIAVSSIAVFFKRKFLDKKRHNQ